MALKVSFWDDNDNVTRHVLAGRVSSARQAENEMIDVSATNSSSIYTYVTIETGNMSYQQTLVPKRTHNLNESNMSCCM